MLLRLISALILALMALTVLAWPIGAVGLHYQDFRAGVQRDFGLSDGDFYFTSGVPPAQFVAHDRFSFFTRTSQAARAPSLFRLWPRVERAGKDLHVFVPFLFMLTTLALAAAVLVGVPLARHRRRRKRSLCANCGYPMAPGTDPCPECGLSRSIADARASRPFRRLVRDAFIACYLLILGACLAAWVAVEADRRSENASHAQSFDYSWYLAACTPHLTGKVAYAVPGAGPDNIENVLRTAGPGSTIVLLPGKHVLGRYGYNPGSSAQDVWLLGADRSTTTLDVHLSACTRLRIEGVTIECSNSPFLDLRSGSTAEVRDCLIQGFNSGAGGVNAVYGQETILLFESCEFEGRSGRQADGSTRGNAFDLRVANRVYLRDIRFTNVAEIFRYSDGTLDHCVMASDQRSWTPYGGNLYQRNCTFPTPLSAPTFTQALDDLAVLRAADNGKPAAPSIWSDPVAREAATALGLDRGVDFWSRLLLHPNPEIRRIAATHLTLKPPPPPKLTPDEAIAALNETPLPPDAALAMLSAPDTVRPRLEQLLAHGNPNPHEAANAAAILRLMSAQPPLPELVRHEAQKVPAK